MAYCIHTGRYLHVPDIHTSPNSAIASPSFTASRLLACLLRLSADKVGGEDGSDEELRNRHPWAPPGREM